MHVFEIVCILTHYFLYLSVDTDDKRGSRWFISNYVLKKKSQSFKAQRMMIDKRFIIGSIFIIVCQAKNNPIEGGQELLAARAVITSLVSTSININKFQKRNFTFR